MSDFKDRIGSTIGNKDKKGRFKEIQISCTYNVHAIERKLTVTSDMPSYK
jgi:hypothetical protein